MPPPKSRAPGGGRGVALGVMGVMLLGFFSLVFMFARHGGGPTAQAHLHLGDLLLHPAHTPSKHGLHPLDKAAPVSQATAKSSGDSVTTAAPSEEAAPQQVPSADATFVATQPTPAAEKPDSAEAEGLTQLDKDYKPTQEMVQRIAQEGYLIVTWANFHYADFVRTWVAHVRKAGITGYLVGAMDDQLLQLLIDGKVNAFSMKSGLTLGDFGWGSATFAKMGREKIKLIRVFLELDVAVIISDVDVIWLRNPVPYFQQYPDADILSSSDHLTNTVPDYSLEVHTRAGSAANIGIMLFRKASMGLVNEWIEIIEKDEKVWDQNAFNDLYKRSHGGVQSIPDGKRNLFRIWNSTLTMGILPVAAFCSGHTYFTQRLWHTLGLEPYAVHATFQFSGTPGKRHRMREFMLFEDQPEYYDHPVGFISFRMDGLKELLPDGGPADGRSALSNVGGHFRLINHQLLRIRTAWAVATALGRALIMPPLWCGLDRWWAPHTGLIPGSHFELPFICPMDHVFDLEGGMSPSLPQDVYGPPLEFREYAFLDNPKLPDAVRRSQLVVELCLDGEEDCGDGSAAATIKGGKVRVQAGLRSDALRTALRDTASFQVLHFTSMAGAMSNFSNPADWTKFFNRVKGIGSIWCCVHQHPGHVWYDPWFDIPHVDRHNRKWDRWEPVCGP